MGFFANIINSITGFFKKEVPIVENAFTSANGIVNVLKTFLGSATGQTVEAIIEALAPGVSGVVIGAINTFFTDFGLVTAELNKTPPQLAADGLNAIGKLTGNSRVLALSNLSSVTGHAVSTANNGGSTLQQAIVSLPIVYNNNVLSDVITPAQSTPAQSIPPYGPVNDAVADTTGADLTSDPAA